MKSIRRHLNYANIVATLALLFAMSGGALAAKHYLINSTKQISPKALQALAKTNTALFDKLATSATVAKAGTANTATSASTAGSAANATNATNAINATNSANATNATNAANASNATHATSATNATTAATATNALSLDGVAASAYQQSCTTGSVAAMAEWYAPGLPTDGTYVGPNRFGGETGFACEGTGLTATLLSTGFIRVKVNGLPEAHELVGFVNADARGAAPLSAYADGPFAGGVFDIHVANEKGVATNPYYIELELLAG
jgi:cytoskeletal protein RodZ